MSMTNQAPELLPCPFCGNEAIVWPVVRPTCFQVGCKRCGGRSDGYPVTSEAVAAWNTRPTPAERPVPQVREALEPFAKAAEQAAWPTFESDNCLVDVSFGLRVRDLRKAREAIAALTARPSDAAVAWRGSDDAIRNLIAREIWRYQECPWDFDKPDAMMGDLQKQIAIDQAEGIRKVVLASAVVKAYFAHLVLPPDEPAPKIDDSVEKACAAYLADAPLDGRHSDAAGGNAYEIIAWAQEELAHFRSQLEPARITPIAELPPMEALPLSVGFAVEYLDGVMTEEQAEIQRMWKLVRTHIMSVSVTPSTVGGEALDAPEPNVDVLPDGRCIPAISDDALWALAATLHSNVPEDKRPMSWSDFSPEQVERLRLAAKALLGKLSPTIASEKECGKAVGEWRDIASAPRDGTNVLLTGDRWTAVGAYWPCNSHWTETMASGMKLNSPTHWQPLPALPAASLIAKG